MKTPSKISKSFLPIYSSQGRKSFGSSSTSTCLLLGGTSTAKSLPPNPLREELTTQSFISLCSALCWKKTPYRDEIQYQSAVARELKHLGFLTEQIEDRHKAGLPDKCLSGRGVTGWLELKYLHKWTGILTQTELTVEQRRFLIEHGREGSGHCYLWVGWWDGTTNRHQIIHWSVILREWQKQVRNDR